MSENLPATTEEFEHTERRGRGRPTDYQPEFCELVMQMGREGYSKAEMAAGLWTSRVTLDAWAKLHPDFLYALNMAQEFSLSWWEKTGRENIDKGNKVQAGLYRVAMSGRFPKEHYRERVDVDVSGTVQVDTSTAKDKLRERLARMVPANDSESDEQAETVERKDAAE